MTEKLRLYGLTKTDKHNLFYIEKKEIFLEKFRDCLYNLGFSKVETAEELLKLMGDADNNFSAKKYSDELYQDKYFYLENDLYKIEVFFGKEKIIVSIFSDSDKQKEIMDQMNNFCEIKEEIK